MHVDGFSAVISCGIKIVTVAPGVPLKFYQPVIIDGVNDSEFALSKWYPASGIGGGFAVFVGTSTRRKEGTARVEIGAFIVKGDDPPSALEVCFLAASEDRTALADYIGRKKTVVATIRNCRLYIADCRFFPLRLCASGGANL
jgi:hypothetical protein